MGLTFGVGLDYGPCLVTHDDQLDLWVVAATRERGPETYSTSAVTGQRGRQDAGGAAQSQVCRRSRRDERSWCEEFVSGGSSTGVLAKCGEAPCRHGSGGFCCGLRPQVWNSRSARRQQEEAAPIFDFPSKTRRRTKAGGRRVDARLLLIVGTAVAVWCATAWRGAE